jgi:hypothetical protein
VDRERSTNNIQFMVNQSYCSVFFGYDAVLLGEFFLTVQRTAVPLPWGSSSPGLCTEIGLLLSQFFVGVWIQGLFAPEDGGTVVCWNVRNYRHSDMASGPGLQRAWILARKNIQAQACCQHLQVFLFHSMWGCRIFSWNVSGFGHWWRIQSVSQTP